MFSIDSQSPRAVDFAPAIERASKIRAARADVLARCCAGGSIGELRAEVAAADPQSAVASMRLLGAVEAIPATGGKVAARRLLARAAIAESATLGAMDDRDWSALAEASAEGHLG